MPREEEEYDEGVENGEQQIRMKQKGQLEINADGKHPTLKEVIYRKYSSNTTFFNSCGCCCHSLAERS